MKYLFFLFLTAFVSLSAIGQSSKIPISIGYYTPYYVNTGVNIGTSFELIKEKNNESSKLKNIFSIPHIGYWRSGSYGNTVTNNWVIGNQIEYRKFAKNQKLYGSASIGLAYFLSLENTTIGIDLSTGNLNYSVNSSHYLVPSVNIGFGNALNDKIGYYLKIFVGHQFGINSSNLFLSGAEGGFTFPLF